MRVFLRMRACVCENVCVFVRMRACVYENACVCL